MHPSPITTAAAKVAEAALVLSGAVVAITARFASLVASTSARAIAASASAPSPTPARTRSVSTSHARPAAARAATSESMLVETPSQTTSTARSPRAHSAMASSLRWCCSPRSHTPPTHSAGAAEKWSRRLGAFAPQVWQ